MERRLPAERTTKPLAESRIRTALLLLLALWTGGCDFGADIRIEDAWIRKPVDGQTLTAGYFKLTNRSEQAITLLGVESAFAEKIEIHSVTENDLGMMQMRPVDSLTIEAGDSLVADGPVHLMLTGIPANLAGAKLTLVFSEGQRLSTAFEVRSSRPDSRGHSH